MENSENLMLDHLKRFQTTLERVESKTDELIIRMGHPEVATVATKREIANVEGAHADLSVRLDRVVGRLERVERRLELPLSFSRSTAFGPFFITKLSTEVGQYRV